METAVGINEEFMVNCEIRPSKVLLGKLSNDIGRQNYIVNFIFSITMYVSFHKIFLYWDYDFPRQA